jgi:hypothetical protein
MTVPDAVTIKLVAVITSGDAVMINAETGLSNLNAAASDDRGKDPSTSPAILRDPVE